MRCEREVWEGEDMLHRSENCAAVKRLPWPLFFCACSHMFNAISSARLSSVRHLLCPASPALPRLFAGLPCPAPASLRPPNVWSLLLTVPAAGRSLVRTVTSYSQSSRAAMVMPVFWVLNLGVWVGEQADELVYFILNHNKMDWVQRSAQAMYLRSCLGQYLHRPLFARILVFSPLSCPRPQQGPLHASLYRSTHGQTLLPPSCDVRTASCPSHPTPSKAAASLPTTPPSHFESTKKTVGALPHVTFARHRSSNLPLSPLHPLPSSL